MLPGCIFHNVVSRSTNVFYALDVRMVYFLELFGHWLLLDLYELAAFGYYEIAFVEEFWLEEFQFLSLLVHKSA